MSEDPVESLSIERLLGSPQNSQQEVQTEENQITEEKIRIQKRIQGFKWRDSRVWEFLTARFGHKLTQDELVSIADLICRQTQLRLDRDARRRKVVLLKWFEENWTIVQPLLHIIVLDTD